MDHKSKALKIFLFGYLRDKDALNGYLDQAITTASQNSQREVADELRELKDFLVLSKGNLDTLLVRLIR
jgi:hypothetical protein